jgi:hypothetical protein
VSHLAHDPSSINEPPEASLTARFWRNTRSGRPAKELSPTASYGARGTAPGEPTNLSAADSQFVADAEFLHAHPAYAGVEIRTTVLTGHLLVADGTDDDVVAEFEATAAQLSDPNDWSICQRVVRQLFAGGFQAVRLRSARSNGTIVIVEHWAALHLLQEEEITHRTISVPLPV